jgi:hypothetical protein
MASVVESRPEEHVFITHYRANSTNAIQRNVSGLPLRIRRLDRFSGEPWIRKPWIGTFVEALWIRLLERKSLAKFRTNLFGEIEKTLTG